MIGNNFIIKTDVAHFNIVQSVSLMKKPKMNRITDCYFYELCLIIGEDKNKLAERAGIKEFRRQEPSKSRPPEDGFKEPTLVYKIMKQSAFLE
ncbi:MAG: hypothetical protein Hyperionvirus4_51 [Hyperionvirus sp.]|uniref:Uncharacterized protein n=1 Tax=Hyperionvirus sp. TaxID=2487770 RepID=A0A3G5A769_9VIRU|nr:MAG: hypothetical protein Hyperionvirus4_51 [Hyperionvirus sp.]